MSNPIIDSLISLTGPDNVVVVYRAFVQFTGSLEAGMMLNQLLYWTPLARLPGGWIAKSDAEWSEELCISSYAARKARMHLIEMGIVESKKAQFSGAPTMHYRIDRSELEAAWLTWIQQSDFAKSQKRFDKDAKTDSAKTQKRSCEIDETITEITPETTPEITTLMAPDPETVAWISDLEAQAPPPRGDPRTTKQLLEDTRQAEAGWIARLQSEPHLTWGNGSEAAQRALAAMDGHADQVRWLGDQMEQVFSLAPDWEDPKEVRRWISELLRALKAARYDPDVVIAAGQKLRKGSCTIAGPWSLVNTARGLAALREGGHHGHDAGRDSGADNPRWTDEDISRAADNAAAALDV